MKTKIKSTVLTKLFNYLVVELSLLPSVDETVHSMIFKIAIQMKVSPKCFFGKIKAIKHSLKVAAQLRWLNSDLVVLWPAPQRLTVGSLAFQ